MANLSENPQWVDGIYQIETSDPVVGGPDGVSNRQAKELASRTRYLKKEQEKTGSDLATHAAAADPHTQYAPKENPTFTGAPKAPTPATESNSQQVATTAFVKSVAATKLAKDQNGADIPDKTTFYSNVLQRGTLGDGVTFSSCDKAGDYFVAISDPNTVSDMPTYKGQKLYGYGVLHISQHDHFVGQEYTSHNGDYAWRQKWNDGVYAPWVVALSSSRVPTAADVGALPEKAVAQAAAKLATPRTINGVPFDGTANIALTPANLGLGETVTLAAEALPKSGGAMSGGVRLGGNLDLPLEKRITGIFSDNTYREMLWLASDNSIQVGDVKSEIAIRTKGSLNILVNDKWYQGYHSGFKPTAADVGAYTKAETDTRVATAATAASNAASAAASANANASGRVPSVRKVNGKALTADITLTADDIGAMPANSPSVKIWVSGEYTPATSTPIVVSHGLVNINPLHCRCDVLIKCITAEGEYRVGDFAINPMTLFMQNGVAHPYSLLPALNTSTVQLNMMHYLAASFKTSTIGNQQLNMANWRCILRIFY
nr:hypothetical protein [Pectobacterium carotovorum]